MEENVKSLLSRLLSMTTEGKLQWKHAGTENSFKLELDSATLVLAFMEMDPIIGESDAYNVLMYNGTGKPVELVTVGASEESTDYQLLSDLYAAVKEATTKRKSTIDKIFKELDDLDLPF